MLVRERREEEGRNGGNEKWVGSEAASWQTEGTGQGGTVFDALLEEGSPGSHWQASMKTPDAPGCPIEPSRALWLILNLHSLFYLGQ